MPAITDVPPFITFVPPIPPYKLQQYLLSNYLLNTFLIITSTTSWYGIVGKAICNLQQSNIQVRKIWLLIQYHIDSNIEIVSSAIILYSKKDKVSKLILNWSISQAILASWKVSSWLAVEAFRTTVFGLAHDTLQLFKYKLCFDLCCQGLSGLGSNWEKMTFVQPVHIKPKKPKSK